MGVGEVQSRDDSKVEVRWEMATKRRSRKTEPLLNTVARKLGYAAGTLAKATHDVTENITAIPEVISEKVRESAKPLRERKRRPKKVRRSRRKPVTAAAHGRKKIQKKRAA